MKRIKKLLSGISASLLIVLLLFTGCSKYSSVTLNVEPTKVGTNVTEGSTEDKNETKAPETQAPDKPTSEVPTQEDPTTAPEKPGGFEVQMTEESIQELNDGNAQFVYSEDGYLTFLKGRYCEQKIESWQDASDSLNCMAQLLGIMSGSDWLVTYGESDSAGYTYWVLQQKYAGLTVAYGTVRIAVDPDGYTAGISSSIVPELGIADTPATITAKEAESLAESYMKNRVGSQYKLYSEYTVESFYSYYNETGSVTTRVFCVYTSNPGGEDLPYLEHIIRADGTYILNMPTKTMTADRESSIDNNGYFANLTADTWSGTVTWDDGSKHKITVPVAYDKEKDLYYLADVERKIMFADYSALVYNNKFEFKTAKDNKSWNDYYLMQMYNMCRAYDFYAGYGIKSPDGMETPILLLTDWVDENGNAPVNAVSMGLIYGWRTFGFSNNGGLEQCADIFVHEYTHSVTGTALCECLYQNEPGAINESYSDIMGELYEQIIGEGESKWLNGQNCSNIARSMSNPNDYRQPKYVGDRYYYRESAYPSNINDQGGVHQNSGLLNYAAYLMNQKGMPPETEAKLWLTTTSLLTPRNSYDEVYLALLMSVEINGFDSKYKDQIKEIFTMLGLLGNRVANADSVIKAGYGKVVIPVDEDLRQLISYAMTADRNTLKYTGDTQIVGKDGTITFIMPKGEYCIEVYYVKNNKNYYARLEGEGVWTPNATSTDYFILEDGDVFTLPAISSL